VVLGRMMGDSRRRVFDGLGKTSTLILGSYVHGLGIVFLYSRYT